MAALTAPLAPRPVMRQWLTQTGRQGLPTSVEAARTLLSAATDLNVTLNDSTRDPVHVSSEIPRRRNKTIEGMQSINSSLFHSIPGYQGMELIFFSAAALNAFPTILSFSSR